MRSDRVISTIDFHTAGIKFRKAIKNALREFKQKHREVGGRVVLRLVRFEPEKRFAANFQINI